VIVALIGAVTLLIAAANRATVHTRSVDISLSPAVLPLYAGYSLLRMIFAYILSLAFTLIYGHVAATSKRAERFMMPILDILQSVPILSFLPSVVLTLVALFPHSSIGVELAAVVLIFTSQAWNMTFSFYHSSKTIPSDLREAAVVYRLSPLRRFFRLEVPFGMIGLVWNSMMSWAGGWFFLMVAEQLQLGNQSFQLPGLGSYLQVAANKGNVGALLLGLGTLIGLIILLDFLFWRPLVAWADKFKFETTRTGDAPQSPILDLLHRSALLEWFTERVAHPVADRFNALMARRLPETPMAMTLDESATTPAKRVTAGVIAGWVLAGIVGIIAAYGIVRGLLLLRDVGPLEWARIIGFGGITFMRTAITMAIALAWTVPVGVKIGMSPKWSRRLQPVVQVVASIPATALFPILLLLLLRLPAGINIAAILLMLLGTQWYMLFNIIAGAMAIPADLRESARIYQVNGWNKWKRLILPSIFPYLVTGLITASGGAWNTSVVAEVVTFNGKTASTPGLGAEIAQAAANGNLPVLLAATLTMATIVVLISRFVWRRLYQVAERRYSLLG
ncbi:MAG TPA: ABC transporter permease subunit, partial [Ktedonobacterales bacterium]|nr:ABC transporter permease subunit [Ktedonobacterales bacterium]